MPGLLQLQDETEPEEEVVEEEEQEEEENGGGSGLFVAARSVRKRRRRPRAGAPPVRTARSHAKALAASRRIRYRVPGSIPLISQPAPMNAWASMLAMMLSWRERRAMSIDEVLGTLDMRYLEFYRRGSGLPAAEKASLLAAADLAQNPPMRYRPEDWEMALRQHGPLWVTEDERSDQLFSMRARLVVAIEGQGSESQTRVESIDPVSGRQRKESLKTFMRRFARPGTRAKGAPRLQVIHLGQGAPHPAPSPEFQAPATEPAAPAPPAPAPAAPALPSPAAPVAPPAAQSLAYRYPAAFTTDLTQYHGFRDGVRWRLVADGVEVEGSGVERTPGTPSTITRIWERFGADINTAATEFNVPCALILATIATESGGNPDAVREEPGYVSDDQTPAKVSPGLMQTLISTARSALGPTEAPNINRAWLLVPLNSIRAGTAYIAQQRGTTELDPPKVACAYNAGGLYHQTGAGNRWKMRQYPIGTGEHCDRFVKWFNDAVHVLASHATQPSVGYATLLGASSASGPVTQPTAPAAQSYYALPFGAVDYDVPRGVAHIQQSNTLRCWAAVAAMMVGWRDGTPITQEAVCDRAGPTYRALFDTNTPLTGPQLRGLLSALGMRIEPGLCYTVDGFANLMRRHGPLWVHGDRDMTQNQLAHAYVATGIHGDGTPTGTMVSLNDPLNAAPHTEAFGTFMARMEAPDPVSVGFQVVHF